jgi:HD-GYP domain-containing protein (c-di-GMP phosphodiesterase class II)
MPVEKPKLTNQFRISNDTIKKSDYDDLSFLIDKSLIAVESDQIQRLDYHQLVDEAMQQLDSVFHYAKINQRIPLLDVQNNIIPLLTKVYINLDLSRLLLVLQRKDHYTLRHSIAVGILSVLIGKWMKLESSDLQSLMLAATLHDIGKALLPEDILNKPQRLNFDEYELVKKHTVFGYQLLKQTVGTSHRQALVALEHHERVDGSGYPFGLDESKISYFGKIVAVADVFHAMSSTRVYHDALPIYRVLAELQDGIFGKFDAGIVTVFIKNTMEFLIGEQVYLSNGQSGSIVLINHVDPMRPLIKTFDGFIDLSLDSSVKIIELID